MRHFARQLLLLAALAGTASAAAGDWDRSHAQRASQHAGQHVGADGSAYLLANEGTRHLLTRVASDGARAWQRDHAGLWAPGANVHANSDRVCVDGGDARTLEGPAIYVAACYARAEGALLWRRELGTADVALSYWTLRSRLLADGSLVLLTLETDTEYGDSNLRLRHRRIGADGTLRHDVPLDVRSAGSEASIDADGYALYNATHDFQSSYVVVDPDGNVVRRIADADIPDFRTRAARAPSGDVWILASDDVDGPQPSSELAVMRFGANGLRDFRWLSMGAGRLSDARFVFDGSAVYVATRLLDGYTYDPDFRLLFRSEVYRVTAPLWRRVMSETGAPPQIRLELDAARREPYVVTDEGFRVGIDVLDPQTGASVRTRLLSPECAPDCELLAQRVGDDGTLRAVLASGDASTAYVKALDVALEPPAPLRLDQPALRGAWYASYSPGQGFLFDFLPQSRTVFGSWFTFGTAPDATAAGLRWYSLQGLVASGATSARLDVLESAGGAFAAQPETVPQRVGSATIALDACDRVAMRYAFDDGRRGTITLSRLSPAVVPCVRADGTAVGTTAASRGGVGVEHAGTWFTPGLSGQGTLLTVEPGGLLFGAWFTYDFGTRFDDPTRQHWFSLQGDLSRAENGRVDAALYRTTGGTLDGAPRTTTTRVGTAVVQFSGCDVATLEYAFDDADAALAFRARAGTLALTRIEGCAP